jgi:MFS transporter, ACS family, DAL5 transporter family protein
MNTCSLTLWYPRHALQFRIGLFFGGAGLALAFSGLLAFTIGYMNGIRGLEGWSWIFVSGKSSYYDIELTGA